MFLANRDIPQPREHNRLPTWPYRVAVVVMDNSGQASEICRHADAKSQGKRKEKRKNHKDILVAYSLLKSKASPCMKPYNSTS